MIGAGILGLFVTLVVVVIVYFAIKMLIDRAPIGGAEPNQAKTWLGYLWLVLCVLWLCYVIMSFTGIATGRLGHI
jgi:hypothetical protein